MFLIELLAAYRSFTTLEAIRKRFKDTNSGREAVEHKRALAALMFWRSTIQPSEVDALINSYLLRGDPWRERFDNARTKKDYCLVFDELALLKDGKPNVDQQEVLDALHELNLAALSGDTRLLLEAVQEHRGALPSSLPPPGPTRVLDAASPEHGPEPLVLNQVGVPTVLPWTETLQQVFEPWHQDHTEKLRRWQALAEDMATPTVEGALVLAVFGQPEAARKMLSKIDTSAWSRLRKIALHRLRGTLARELGSQDQAVSFYGRAYADLSHLTANDEPAKTWLQRRLILDTNRLQEMRSSSNFFQESHERHQEMLSMQAWYSIPVIDEAVRASQRAINEEAFKRRREGVHPSRSDNELYTAWLEHIKALLFAYAAGDHLAVQNSLQDWALRLATLPSTGTDGVLRDIIQTLWRLRDGKRLGTLIHQSPPGVIPVEELERMLLEQPLNPLGIDAERLHLAQLELIPTLTPYLLDSTVDRVRGTLTAAIITFTQKLKTSSPDEPRPPTQVVEGDTYSPAYAMEALTALTYRAALLPAELDQLVTALAGTTYTHGSAWEVVSAHIWRPEDAPVAARVVKALLGHPTEDVFKFLNQAEILLDIARAYPEMESAQDALHQMLTGPLPRGLMGHHAEDDRWRALLRQRLPAAVPYLQEHAARYFEQEVRRLEGASEDDRVTLYHRHPMRLLPQLFNHYPEVIAVEVRVDWWNRLALVAKNAALFVQYKIDLYETLKELLPFISAEERVALVSLLEGPGDWALASVLEQPDQMPTAAPVQFDKMLLLIALGKVPGAEDVRALLETLVKGSHSERRAALAAAHAILLETDVDPGARLALLSSVMMIPLQLPDLGGDAIYLLARHVRETDALFPVVLLTLQAVVDRRTVRPIIGLLSGLLEREAIDPVRLALAPQIRWLTTHAHAGVRALTGRLTGLERPETPVPVSDVSSESDLRPPG